MESVTIVRIRSNFFIRLLPILLVCYFLIACAQVPITHRQSLQLLPESQLASMSLQEYDKVLEKSKLSTNREQVEMVRRVGSKIAQAAEAFLADAGMQSQIKNLNWEFNLIEDDKTANAWVMPGGKAAVYTGILKYTRDETGLAVVLGHEVAHAIAGHGNERMSQALLAQMGGAALSVALSENSAMTRNLFMQAYGAGATVGLLLPYSRLHESEADRIGLTLMARAGYDPREAVPFWQRMNEQGGRRPPELLSTHPAPATRIANIQKYIPEALVYYKKS
ncbi:MAG: M48 family metallopeptidase [Desulfobacterales bacterium]|jgi:predicted Zn-dependent protease